MRNMNNIKTGYVQMKQYDEHIQNIYGNCVNAKCILSINTPFPMYSERHPLNAILQPWKGVTIKTGVFYKQVRS